jgi:hypothetical protein
MHVAFTVQSIILPCLITTFIQAEEQHHSVLVSYSPHLFEHILLNTYKKMGHSEVYFHCELQPEFKPNFHA